MPLRKQKKPAADAAGGNNEIGYIKPREITDEMSESYLDYAMTVIVSRALPDVRDGLKPVHRRILYSMHSMGLRHNVKFRKSATVVGYCLGAFHPHGDIAVYDALVRMAQGFSLRYPLVQGQGNFGCFTKDTKVRLIDGRSLGFGELIKEQRTGKRHWTFSFNIEAKKIEIAEIQRPRLTRRNEKLMEVTLDNGEKIKCTLDHRFMLKSGGYKQAQELKPGDSLMPLLNQKTTGNLVAFGGLRPARNSGLSTYNQYSKIKNFVKPSVVVDNQKTVEVPGIEPGRPWLTNPVSSRSTPAAVSLYQNHKVLETKMLKRRQDVYDLTCGPWHNFLLAAGVFVHNSIDGDSPAAQRYTESRMSRMGEDILADIEKDTVKFMPNYDGTRTEPTVLPSPVPQLLLNGSLGIAVGMATNIPPHNASEVLKAAVYLVDHPKADTEDLFQFVKGPDFPTAGIIYNKKEIITAYSQGKGPILTRGKAEINERTKDSFQLIISEIPYYVQKSTLVQQFARLVEAKKIDGIKDIRDESDREGMRIVIELKKEAFPKKVLNALYKYTDLQKTFHLNMMAIVDGIQPKVLSLVDVLNYYLEHKKEVVVRRTKFDLEKAKQRAHILDGLMTALKKIDDVIRTIKKSESKEAAHKNLCKKFKLSALQATAILEMKLQSLAKLEREKIEKELEELKRLIKELSAILKSPKRINEVMKKELSEMEEKYRDERRTKVVIGKQGGIEQEDLVPKEETIITLTQGGYIKRMKPALYKAQKRGGIGMLGIEVKGEDAVEHFLAANTLDKLLFFAETGKVFQCLVWEIPEMTRVSKGRGLLNFLEISANEKILNLIPYSKQDASKKNYLVMTTKNGIIKKTELSLFDNVRRSGLLAIKLQSGDHLRAAKIVSAGNELILVTKLGKSIRFREKDIRSMGRTASGVRGIRLASSDEVIGMSVVGAEKQEDKAKRRLLIITENGYGKRTKVSEYRLQRRGGSGIKAARITDKTGNIVFSKMVDEAEHDLIVISSKGQVIKTSIGSISIIGRASSGVRVMKMKDGDKVASAICL